MNIMKCLAAATAAFFMSGCSTSQKLSDAVHQEDVATIIAMVEDGLDPMTPTASGETPFDVVYQHAFESADSDRQVEKLLPDFANQISRRSEQWASDLCSKVRNRTVDVNEFKQALEDRPGNVSMKIRGSRMSIDNHVPLEFCLTSANKTEFLGVLLDNGGNPNAIGRNGRTVLELAVYYGLTDAVDKLIAAGSDPNLTIREDSNILALFLGAGSQGNRVNDPVILSFVLSTGMNVDARIEGATPLERAVISGRRNVVESLLLAGANPDRALHAASYYGEFEMVSRLIEAGADTGSNSEYQGGTALHTAINGIADGHYEDLRVPLLIAESSSNQSLNHADDEGYTVLGMAEMIGNSTLVEALKGMGASRSNQPQN